MYPQYAADVLRTSAALENQATRMGEESRALQEPEDEPDFDHERISRGEIFNMNDLFIDL